MGRVVEVVKLEQWGEGRGRGRGKGRGLKGSIPVEAVLVMK